MRLLRVMGLLTAGCIGGCHQSGQPQAAPCDPGRTLPEDAAVGDAPHDLAILPEPDLADAPPPKWTVYMTPMNYWSVWARNPNDVFVGGSGGIVLHSVDRGISWEEQVLEFDSIAVHGLWGTGMSDVFATGEPDGLPAIVQSRDDGAHWTPQFLEDPKGVLWSVHGAGSDLYVPLYSYDAVLHSTDLGATWNTLVIDHLVRNFTSVWCADPGTVWIGGNWGIFASRDAGMTWEEQTPMGFTWPIWSMWGTSRYLVHAAGGMAALRTVDGMHWSVTTLVDQDSNLYATHGSSETDIWVGGSRGQLFRSRDGGATWKPVQFPVDREIRGIFALSPTDVYVVGDSPYNKRNPGGFIAHWN